MPRPRRLPLLVLAAVSLACASTPPTSPAAGADGAELAAVVDAVQQALTESETRSVPGFPPLKSATVKLQTEASRGVDGEIALYVLAIGSRYSADTTSTIELKLKPGTAERTLAPAAELKDALAKAIALAKAAAARAGQGTPPFSVAEVEIEVKFAVERSGSAGAKVKLVPVGVDVGGSLGRNAVQSLVLVFGR